MTQTATQLSVDGDRTVRELHELARFADATPPAVTRVVFTETDRRARAWLKERFREAGLDVREDAVGNTFARWQGSEPHLPAVGTGSHTDAIPDSGLYDGTVGVLGGLEAIRALQRTGFVPRRSIEILMFTSEEPTRFGLGCLGSRLLSGSADIAKIDALRDGDGFSVREAARSAGFTGELESVRLAKSHYAAFAELHIEQGPLLEREGLAIGAVEAIAAPAAIRATFEGAGGHAGTVLMPDRRDALTGAAELALAVERTGRTNGSPDTVATVGVFRPFPGAVNSIPSRCVLEIDVRDTDGSSRDRAVSRILEAGDRIARERSLQFRTEILNSDPPARCDARIVRAVEEAARAEGLAMRHMVSRAYHDSLFMARVAPVAMIFIPCRNGWSHRPDEYSSPEHIAAGIRTLARTLATLSHSQAFDAPETAR